MITSFLPFLLEDKQLEARGHGFLSLVPTSGAPEEAGGHLLSGTSKDNVQVVQRETAGAGSRDMMERKQDWPPTSHGQVL